MNTTPESGSTTNIDAWLEAGRMADGVRMSDERLSEVFDLVKPAGNWKYPLDAFVADGAATVAEVVTAVTWFAGGLPDIIREAGGFRVVGAGYYAWVGA